MKKASKKKKASITIEDTLFNTHVLPEVHAEYIRLTGSLNAYVKKELPDAVRILQLKRTPLNEKKVILLRLAKTLEPRALYGIQKYLHKPDTELTPFAVIAWNQAQTGVLNKGFENMFGHEPEQDYMVMGGLGGDRNRLRFIYVVSAIDDEQFNDSQKTRLDNAVKKWDQLFGRHSLHEKVEFRESYAICTVLFSHDIAPDTCVTAVINTANESEKFLRFHYFMLNTHIPTMEEIQQYLDEVKDVL